ncbi:MAG: alpha/beta hydrolase [Cytophagales bacterium]|nr:alpha/beta hydrolase [Cytophagales bacterium]
MNRSCLLVFVFSAMLLAAGCVGLKHVQKTNIEGRQVEYAVAGEGRPTIVFESGMGRNLNTWKPIFDSLSKCASVFASNRPGYGHSSLKNAPRTIREAVVQLHQNLNAIGLKPPYILVGHSAGGLYINMFARLFPDETAGVVFLDASHPDQFEYFRKHQSALYNILITSIKKGKRRYEESIVKSAHSDFKSVPPFPDVPIAVLTAGEKSSPLETVKMRKKWLEFQKELAGLSEKSTHVIVEKSGHFIHKDSPDIVIGEIIRLAEF